MVVYDDVVVSWHRDLIGAYNSWRKECGINKKKIGLLDAILPKFEIFSFQRGDSDPIDLARQ